MLPGYGDYSSTDVREEIVQYLIEDDDEDEIDTNGEGRQIAMSWARILETRYWA